MGNKGGQLTSFQIIGFILVIASFAILLLVVYPLFSGSDGSDEVCKLSVLTRATVPEATQGYIPLKCQTDKICLSDGTGDGKCGDYFAEGEADKIKLDKNSDSAARKVEEVFANEMYDCWSMMGQGRLSLFNGGVLEYYNLDSPNKVSCVICSRIVVEHGKIDEVLKHDGNGVDVNSYLEKTKVPGSGLTYLQTFTDEHFKSYPSAAKIDDEDKIVEFGAGESNEMAIVFSQIKVPDYSTAFGKLLSAGAVGIGGSFAVGGLSTLKIFANPIALAIIIPAAAGVTIISMSNVYAGRATAAGYCGKVTTTLTEKGASNGCSSVSIVPYNVRAINDMCGILEGSP